MGYMFPARSSATLNSGYGGQCFWGDSIPSNVIFRPDGTVSGLIDWTSAELGPSELDLA